MDFQGTLTPNSHQEDFASCNNDIKPWQGGKWYSVCCFSIAKIAKMNYKMLTLVDTERLGIFYQYKCTFPIFEWFAILISKILMESLECQCIKLW
jgi:hypothetical protein